MSPRATAHCILCIAINEIRFFHVQNSLIAFLAILVRRALGLIGKFGRHLFSSCLTVHINYYG